MLPGAGALIDRKQADTLVRAPLHHLDGGKNMVGEGTTAIFITFLLAIVGYIGLTAVVLITLQGKVPVAFWRCIAAVILAHVVLVWTFRYKWEFALAVRNGYAGFVMFHAALLMIVGSTFAKARAARLLIRLAFVVVTIGALGASFLYDVVALYRVPVIVCAVAGGAGLIWAFFSEQQSTT